MNNLKKNKKSYAGIYIYIFMHWKKWKKKNRAVKKNEQTLFKKKTNILCSIFKQSKVIINI